MDTKIELPDSVLTEIAAIESKYRQQFLNRKTDFYSLFEYGKRQPVREFTRGTYEHEIAEHRRDEQNPVDDWADEFVSAEECDGLYPTFKTLMRSDIEDTLFKHLYMLKTGKPNGVDTDGSFDDEIAETVRHILEDLGHGL